MVDSYCTFTSTINEFYSGQIKAFIHYEDLYSAYSAPSGSSELLLMSAPDPITSPLLRCDLSFVNNYWSLDVSHVPQQWKMALVRLKAKTDSPSSPTEYRPGLAKPILKNECFLVCFAKKPKKFLKF